MSSPPHINKLTNYNSTNRSLLNRNICLRDLYNETSKGGQPEINREVSTDGWQNPPCSQALEAQKARRGEKASERSFLPLGGTESSWRYWRRGSNKEVL